MRLKVFAIILISFVFILSCKKDKTDPVITILGDNPYQTYVGYEYDDEGATASDNEDGDITDLIETVNEVDTSEEGEYTVTYTVSDEAGNTASETRTVNVLLTK